MGDGSPWDPQYGAQSPRQTPRLPRLFGGVSSSLPRLLALHNRRRRSGGSTVRRRAPSSAQPSPARYSRAGPVCFSSVTLLGPQCAYGRYRACGPKNREEQRRRSSLLLRRLCSSPRAAASSQSLLYGVQAATGGIPEYNIILWRRMSARVHACTRARARYVLGRDPVFQD